MGVREIHDHGTNVYELQKKWSLERRPYSHKDGLSRLTFELRVSRHRQEGDDDANLKSSHTNTGTLLPYEVTTI